MSPDSASLLLHLLASASMSGALASIGDWVHETEQQRSPTYLEQHGAAWASSPTLPEPPPRKARTHDPRAVQILGALEDRCGLTRVEETFSLHPYIGELTDYERQSLLQRTGLTEQQTVRQSDRSRLISLRSTGGATVVSVARRADRRRVCRQTTTWPPRLRRRSHSPSIASLSAQPESPSPRCLSTLHRRPSSGLYRLRLASRFRSMAL